MPDITMCTQTLCPNASICHRITAKPSYWQSYSTFHYTVGVEGCQCDYFIENFVPMKATDSTKENDR